MAFNLGNYLNDHVFNQREFKNVTNTIGNIGGKFISFGSTMINNMMQLYFNISFLHIESKLGFIFSIVDKPVILYILLLQVRGSIILIQ